MKEKTLRSKLLIFGILFFAMTTGSVIVSADTRAISSDSLNVGGTNVDIISVTGEKMASGTTAADYYNPDITASVSAIYSSIDPSIMSPLPQDGFNQGTSSAVVSFLAPENHVTNWISCYHRAKKGNYYDEYGNTMAYYYWDT